MRKHYGRATTQRLLTEIDKDLAAHTADDVIDAIAAHQGLWLHGKRLGEPARFRFAELALLPFFAHSAPDGILSLRRLWRRGKCTQRYDGIARQ